MAPPPAQPPGKDGNKTQTVSIIVVSIVMGLILIAICIFIILRKMQKRKAKSYANYLSWILSGQMDTTSSIDYISSVKFDFTTIQKATSNFLEANMVGRGHFGAVYKGRLENGVEVAVKRLSENLNEGNLEFKNAVALMAKLQHRNLVRLLDFSLEGKEMLLAWTHWKSGAASNVIDPMLLRGASSPVHEITKCIHVALLCVQESVVDRPTMVEVLQMLSNLSMSLPVPLAPGFFIHGNVNSKASNRFTRNEMSNSDKYPGKMQKQKVAVESLNYDFNTIQNATDNFSEANKVGSGILGPVYKAWTHWKKGSSLNVIDPMLRGVSSPVPDIIKCFQVALLCVQEKVEDRPTMGEVVQMLSNLSTSFPVPSAPPFFIPSRENSDDAEGSINEMSISDDN
nr:putative receptor-like protein kinase At4g00960 [Ipomoea batatas]